MDLLDKTRSEMVNFYSSDRKTEILKIHNPSRNMLRSIITEGGIEFLLIERRLSIDESEFTARVIENRIKTEIGFTAYKGYRERTEDYDFVYNEISHSIYVNGSFVRSINELSPLAALIRYFAENRHPSGAAEIAEYIYNSGSKNKASLVRQRKQEILEIHPDLIINVRPYKRYILNSELNTLFILAD